VVKLYKEPCKKQNNMNHSEQMQENTPLVPDLTEIEEVRKAFITNEILNRKY
jgi:hypothetical protein